jgi:dTDP-4-dehydrorhamnose reductase
MKILLLGAKGQLGVELSKVLPQLGELILISRNELDLSNINVLEQKLNAIAPDLIVNASAYTNVDMAEKEKDLAKLINASIPGLLAKFSAQNNSILVHYSTDYVFDGTKEIPYFEIDNPNPLSVYGTTKLLGEELIFKSGCRNLILRTSWLFSSHGQNFLTTILNLGFERNTLKVVNDQFGTPTSCEWLASTTIELLTYCLTNERKSKSLHWGLYHATHNGFVNWYEYAKFILEKAKGLHISELKPATILPISTFEYKQEAIRPFKSILNSQKIENLLNYKRDNWSIFVAKEIKKHSITLPIKETK